MKTIKFILTTFFIFFTSTEAKRVRNRASEVRFRTMKIQRLTESQLSTLVLYLFKKINDEYYYVHRYVYY